CASRMMWCHSCPRRRTAVSACPSFQCKTSVPEEKLDVDSIRRAALGRSRRRGIGQRFRRRRSAGGGARAGAGELYPRYNEVYGTATHNSYWLNRSDRADFFASGTQEILSDQFLHEHIRAIELDIHSEGAPAGRWKV